MIAAVDNDIIFKGACYSILHAVTQILGGQPNELGVLSEARFVVEKAIRSADFSGDINSALDAARQFIDAAVVLDPTDDEQNTAAELEYRAQEAGLPLDVGESLLCAIVMNRTIPLLLTGDKRAIESLQHLLGAHPPLAAIVGRVKCLEQLVLALVGVEGVEAIRKKICAQAVDRSLIYCFSCFQQDIEAQSVVDGLNSYIGDLRGRAPDVLAP